MSIAGTTATTGWSVSHFQTWISADSSQMPSNIVPLWLLLIFLVTSFPSELCSWIPFLVILDLSNNRFSGSIPGELGNCTYLNKLMLNHNKLCGNIPPEIARLTTLKVLSLANNNLSGNIPPFSGLTHYEFGGNRHLCCGSSPKCGWRWEKLPEFCSPRLNESFIAYLGLCYCHFTFVLYDLKQYCDRLYCCSLCPFH